MNYYQCVVQISSEDGTSFLGTGFFLTPKVLVTCKHVLQEHTQVSFSRYGEKNDHHRASVCEAVPGHDLVWLECKDDYSIELELPRIASISNAAKGRKLESFGYQDIVSPSGTHHPSCTSVAPTFKCWTDLDEGYFLKLGDARGVVDGFSGAPVWALDEKNKPFLIGIIKRYIRLGDGGGTFDAYAISADLLKTQFPDCFDDRNVFIPEEPRWQGFDYAGRSEKKKPSQGFKSMRFVERWTDFRPSPGVMEALKAFRDSEEPFSWWLITGGAGAGKSRTALEFCKKTKEQEEGWRADFVDLKNIDKDMNWAGWWPKQDTFIVKLTPV